MNEVRVLWHNGFWDCMLNGVCLWNGVPAWFAIENEAETDEPARYSVHAMTLEELGEELHWHGWFQVAVGTHCDYDPEGVRQIGSCHYGPCSSDDFYFANRKRGRREYSRGKVLGRFERISGGWKVLEPE
jgi:hypothetical protein